MDDLNKPLVLDEEHNTENNKNSNNLSDDEIQKKSFQVLSEKKLPLDTEEIIQEAESVLVSKKEITEKNEKAIIKDGDSDVEKLKQIKIEHNLEKDNARVETLKINQLINEQKKQLKMLHEEGLKIDQNMLNFEKNKNQLQVEFIYKQKKLINKGEEEIKEFKNLNQEHKEKITSLEEVISSLRNKEEEFKNLNQKYEEKIKNLEKVVSNFKIKFKIKEEEIKFYQNDNLRLSRELFEVSKKLEDTKQRINEFENKKFQIQEQIHNLNQIISKNNIVKEQFPQNNNIENISNTVTEEKLDTESDFSSKDHEETIKEVLDIDLQTKKIFQIV